MRVNNRLAAAGKRVWVSTTALGLHFSLEGEWIAARRGQTKRGVGFSGVLAWDSGRGAGVTDLSPAAAGQRGKLYRHLSVR